MKVTFFGTTTLLFDDGKDQILFDAHFTRPSLIRYMFGSAGTNAALVDELLAAHHVDRLRAIFVSHTHHDHVMDAPQVARKTGATIYGTASAMNVARGGGVTEDRLVEFRGGEAFEVGDYRVRVIPSLHSRPSILNDDLGVTIDAPLRQPARLRSYHEGGSYDFFVEAGGRRFLIRPSFNYIEGQLDGIRADVLFLGVAGLAKADARTEARFFAETVGKVRPSLVIPLHWDNFFKPLDRPATGMYPPIERTEVSFFKLARYCESKGINCLLQIPRTSIEI